MRLQEASRNELLALAKSQTITRYNKAEEYKGFSIRDIKTDEILNKDMLIIICRVGDYEDTVALEDILIWVQMCAEQSTSTRNQINSKVVTQAIMNSIDGMDILVNCSCADFKYRFAYMATQLGYKYGEPQNERNKYHRTNKENYGSMCKHLVALLSNKRWLQQITSRFVDWLIENIDEVNKYLRLPEDKMLTVPDVNARLRGKQSQYSKFAQRVERIEDIAQEYKEDRLDFIEHNEDAGIIEDIKRWLKDNYTDNNGEGYDYVKATPEEIKTILNIVTKDLDRSNLGTNDENINNDEDNIEVDDSETSN